MKESIGRGGCGGGGGSGQDRIDALGGLLTRILRHTAPQLNLNMRSDGYVKVQDLLRLNLKTFANVAIKSHTVDDIKELVKTESLFKPILSAEEFPGNNTYKKDANILIFLDIRKALQDKKVILTEGFDGVVPVEYFERIESWLDRKLITFDQKFESLDGTTTTNNNELIE
ncbi:hypothetical protein L1987_58899 [Smallanthus sonchifolius]|uniref:Uncharacterized protein n=1 Tax=Smallanthus sonchifolius TaxID=185202 RepID=A0ACB9D3S6_9ASTR|nr:hypothetical protein L1987_58899 [Smallanthus sonchifolius]